MIHPEEAERQALRLSVLPGMERIELETDEIIDALKRASRNLDHADRIVTEALNRFGTIGTVPTPAEIIKLAQRTDSEFDPREWRCSECGGTGWRPVFQLHTWSGVNRKSVQVITREQHEKLRTKVSGVTGEQLVTSAVEDCHCAVGRKRVEGRAADAIEEAAKVAAKSTSREKRQRTM